MIAREKIEHYIKIFDPNENSLGNRTNSIEIIYSDRILSIIFGKFSLGLGFEIT